MGSPGAKSWLTTMWLGPVGGRIFASPPFVASPARVTRIPAPQNLYPVGELERRLRRLLAEPELLYRSLRQAAAAVVSVPA